MIESNKEKAKASLTNFLQVDTKKVAVLKGPWGIGKTYFWKNDFVKNISKDNSLRTFRKKYKTYSYISLFGVSNRSELYKKAFVSKKAFANNKYSIKKSSEENCIKIFQRLLSCIWFEISKPLFWLFNFLKVGWVNTELIATHIQENY